MTEEEKRQMALKCAMENGFDDVEYLEDKDGYSVFSAGFKDEEADRFPTGLPCFIMVNEDGAFESFGFEPIVKISSEETEYPRGKKIFERLEQYSKHRLGAPEYMIRYADEIVHACNEYSYDCPIEKETMYEYLEKADKTNKKVVIIPDDGQEGKCDGWTYHLELIDRNEYTEDEKYWSIGGNSGTLPDRITPSRINALDRGEIFVFGSNKQGYHGGGAARTAMNKFGAEWGNGEGLQGQSYALPTMEGMESTKAAVDRFTEYAEDHSEYLFYVTAVGCGIAGYQPEEIAPLFEKAAELDNVYLPLSFWIVLMPKSTGK